MRAHATLILGQFLGQTLTPELASRIVALFPQEGRPLDLGQFPAWDAGRIRLSAECAAGILPELHVLHEKQWVETEAYMGGVKMDPAVEDCLLDEAHGRLLQLVARDRETGEAVGHMRMYLTRSRHTRRAIALEDTMYLLPQYRAGRNALRMLEHMEACMRLAGMTGIYLDDKVANPAVGRLLAHLNYEHIANRRYKSLEA